MVVELVAEASASVGGLPEVEGPATRPRIGVHCSTKLPSLKARQTNRRRTVTCYYSHPIPCPILLPQKTKNRGHVLVSWSHASNSLPSEPLCMNGLSSQWHMFFQALPRRRPRGTAPSPTGRRCRGQRRGGGADRGASR